MILEKVNEIKSITRSFILNLFFCCLVHDVCALSTAMQFLCRIVAM